MLSYFDAQGYSHELHDNPADFVLDVLIDVSQRPTDLKKLTQAYVESEIFINFVSVFMKQRDDDILKRSCRKQQEAEKLSFSTELYYILQRAVKNNLRNPEAFISSVLMAIISASIFGLTFYDIQKTIEYGARDRLIFFAIIIFLELLITQTAIELFIQERILFIHVRSIFIDTIPDNELTICSIGIC
jgi:ABC-2 type transporter